MYAAKALEDLQAENEDQKRGIQIIQNALKVYDLLAFTCCQGLA